MAGVLEVFHFAEHDRVTEVDVRGGGIEADFDRQALSLDPPRELLFLDQIDGPAAQDLELRRGGSYGGTG
jgi:hypothetical protein